MQIQDNHQEKFALVESYATRDDWIPPVYIISHARHNNLTTLKNLPWLRGHVTLVVAHTDYPAYRSSFPTERIMVIPAGYGGHDIGVGRAHAYTIEMAHLMGEERCLILNDDLRSLYMMYNTVPGQDKVSQARRSLHNGTREDFFRGIIGVFVAACEEAFTVHPESVVGAVQANNPDRHTKSTRRRWELNVGGPPAQLTYWNVDNALRVGFNLREFNYHGDDISLACDIAEQGMSVVKVPSILSSWGDYETESVLRTPDTAPGLRQKEHDSLMTKPRMAPYIKTRYDRDGNPKWHSLNYPALKRDGLVPTGSALWSDPVLS